MMKTIFQINSVVNSGSTGRIAEEIGSLAMDKGWNSYIAYGRWANVSQSKLIRIGNWWDIYMHGFVSRFFDRHGFASVNPTIRLIEQIQAIKPDIVHLHNIHGYYINIKMLFDYLSLSRIPVVWTLHDCWAITGHCAYFTFIGCERWKSGCFDCPQLNSYPRSLIMDKSKRNYQDKKLIFNSIKDLTLVPVSNWLVDIVSQSFLKHNDTLRIYNGINTDVFSPKSNGEETKRRLGIETKFMIIGVASVWSNRKGLNDFIRLNSKLSTEYSIVLVGLSKKQIQNLPNGIIGISRTENTVQLAELYSAADVFINPTWEDNFPTTNLEALAAGTPIITYRTGGSVEAIVSKTGFIVDQGDIQGLIDVIETIRIRTKVFYSENCRRYAIKNFRKEDRYADYIQLYEDIIKKRR